MKETVTIIFRAPECKYYYDTIRVHCGGVTFSSLFTPILWSTSSSSPPSSISAPVLFWNLPPSACHSAARVPHSSLNSASKPPEQLFRRVTRPRRHPAQWVRVRGDLLHAARPRHVLDRADHMGRAARLQAGYVRAGRVGHQRDDPAAVHSSRRREHGQKVRRHLRGYGNDAHGEARRQDSDGGRLWHVQDSACWCSVSQRPAGHVRSAAAAPAPRCRLRGCLRRGRRVDAPSIIASSMR